MKKLSVLCAALLAAVMSFATVTYELNGGVQNAYGWQTDEDMWHTLNALFNEYRNIDSTSTNFTWPDLATCRADISIAAGIPTACYGDDPATGRAMAGDFFQSEKCSAAFGWLITYMQNVCIAQGKTSEMLEMTSAAASVLRYNVQAFFDNSCRTSYPYSADYATCGVSTVSAYQPTWKSGFCNPTEPTEEFTLNAPYYEGMTFKGWYASADFSGDRIYTVDATTTGTLYAKWVEYIPTVGEIKAFAADTETKAQGTVTFANGKKAYIADATGGICIMFAADQTLTNGQYVTVKGKVATVGGAMQLVDATVESTENGTVFPSTTLVADSVLTQWATYYGQPINVLGVTVKAVESGVITLTNDVVEFKCAIAVDNTITVDAKVSVSGAVVGYNDGVILEGTQANLILAGGAGHDDFVYPARGDMGQYTLENKWLYSNTLDNFQENKPGSDDYVRGLAVRDGIFYFISREREALLAYDGATGARLKNKDINLAGKGYFKDSVGGDVATLKFNDVKLDNAGHFIIGGCYGNGQTIQIWKVENEETGEGKCLVNERLWDNPDFAEITAWRSDNFGVYGDVDTKARIMIADASGMNVWYWDIENGETAPAEQITISPEAEDNSQLVGVASLGTAAAIFPVDFNYFYIDGWPYLPELFDMDGVFVDGFNNIPTGKQITNGAIGDTTATYYTMQGGHNGLVEFQVGEDYFLLMASTNTATKPYSTFALFKYADAAKEFSGLTPMWIFPNDGMGAQTDGARVAVPSVQVDGNKAYLYVYTMNNGYGMYEFTGVDGGDGIEETKANEVKAVKFLDNGRVFIMRNGVRYNVLGVVE